jgi:hypothetical protein
MKAQNVFCIILSRARVTIEGVWIGNWVFDHLQMVTTSNYSAIANSHALQFTTAHTMSFQSAVS